MRKIPKKETSGDILFHLEYLRVFLLFQFKDKTIKITQQGRLIIYNKTINFLNTKLGDIITMEQFLYNIQHHEQLIYQEWGPLEKKYKKSLFT